eukprot:2403846-Pleurochrysis_carterae.AAC.4
MASALGARLVSPWPSSTEEAVASTRCVDLVRRRAFIAAVLAFSTSSARCTCTERDAEAHVLDRAARRADIDGSVLEISCDAAIAACERRF